MKPLLISILVLALLPVTVSNAEENRLAGSTRQTQTMYVNDELWITVRAEADANAEKIAVIKSGVKMAIISYQDGDDYAEVLTEDGKSGWVLYRYLSDEPPASLILEQTETALTTTQTKLDELNTALSKLKKTNQQQSSQLKELQNEKQQLEKELDEIRAVSDDAIKNHQLTQTLQQQTDAAEKQAATLKQDNESLQSRLIGYAIGAAIFGLIVGLYLGTIPLRRDKRWRSMP